jgi:GR25 family glycosyltransferase involved in LPS biosynthesis
MARVALFLLLFAGVLLAVGYLYVRRGSLATVHVINMDSSTERLLQFQTACQRAGLTAERWRAVNGKALGPKDILSHGVPRGIYDKYEQQKRLGVIGCYLSHSTLLKHLESVPAGANDYHLIFEDDAVMPATLKADLPGLLGKLPADWDLFQLYNNRPATKPYDGVIHTLLPGRANWGSVAYCVRHSALPKINAHIATMRKPIDDQMLEKAQTWKWFCMVPNYVETVDGGRSTLDDGNA